MTAVAVSDILLSPIAFALVGYVVIAIVLAIAVRPLRLQLVDVVEAMLDEKHWTERQRVSLNSLVDHSMSFCAGLALPLAVISVTIDEILNRPIVIRETEQALHDDPRFDHAMRLFIVSLAAANPLAALLTMVLLVPSMLLTSLVKAAERRPNVIDMVEVSALRAASAVQTPQRASC